MTDYGVRTVVDLRFPVELEEDPPRDVDLDVVHLSLLGEPDHERWTALEARATATGTAAGFTRMVYLEALEQHNANLAAAVAAVGHAGSRRRRRPLSRREGQDGARDGAPASTRGSSDG